jgi:hypothetical protein
MLRDINGIKFVVGDEIKTGDEIKMYDETIIFIIKDELITYNSKNNITTSWFKSDIIKYNMRIIDPMKQRALDKNGDMVQVGDTVDLYSGYEYKITDIIKSTNDKEYDCVKFNTTDDKGWDYCYSHNCVLVKPEQTKVKVSIGDETTYISAESVKEFKRMLDNIK